MNKLAAYLVDARKFLVAAAGVLAQAIEVGVLHGNALHWAQVASAGIAAALVYLVPNGVAAPADSTGPGHITPQPN